MKRIELIGPSGVGKTTLYNYLDELSQNSRNYLTIREAYRDAALSTKISIRYLDLLFYQFLLRYNLTLGKERGVGKVIIQALETKKSYDHNKYNNYSVSFDILCHQLMKSKNPYLIQKEIKRFLKKVDDWMHLQTYLQDKKIVLFDEGMLHYHDGIDDFCFEKFSRDQLKADEAFRPAGIIYCTLNSDDIYAQAVRRKSEGIISFTHGQFEGKELMDFIKRNVELNFKKAIGYKKIGIPVLEINTGDEALENAEKINEFVLSL